LSRPGRALPEHTNYRLLQDPREVVPNLPHFIPTWGFLVVPELTRQKRRHDLLRQAEKDEMEVPPTVVQPPATATWVRPPVLLVPETESRVKFQDEVFFFKRDMFHLMFITTAWSQAVPSCLTTQPEYSETHLTIDRDETGQAALNYFC
jgi:hypothetical protein